jgi:hypothetical protein
MNELIATFSRLLSEVVVPSLKSVQASQTEQIAANDRLELAIEELRAHLDSQFSLLTAQLIACQAELTATQAALKAAQAQEGWRVHNGSTLVH